MARIFNIYFSYENQVHSAVVSVRKTPFFSEYTLANIEEELLRQLPGNKIVSSVPGHFIFQNATETHSVELMNSIIKAVAEHLQATEA